MESQLSLIRDSLFFFTFSSMCISRSLHPLDETSARYYLDVRVQFMINLRWLTMEKKNFPLARELTWSYRSAWIKFARFEREKKISSSAKR